MSARRDLRILMGAGAVSAAGDIAAVSALAVWVQQRTHSGIAVAAVFVAVWLALAIAAPAAGALVDRRDARLLLIVASAFQAAVASLLASTPGIPGVLALTALLGVGGAITVPAEFALVGALAAAGPGVAGANARVETARNLGYLIGPIAGTGLVALAGVGAALAADAATFAVIACAALALRVRRPGSAGASRSAACAGSLSPSGARARPRALDGIGLLARDPVLRLTIAVLIGSLIAMSTSITADVFFVRQTLHAGPIGLGLLLSAWTLGMVIGSLALAPRVGSRSLPGSALGGTVVQGGGKLLAAGSGLLAPALVFYAFGGAGHGVKNVSARALIHERVEASAHGRAFAAYAALRNCAELAALGLGGALVGLVGARVTLILAGGLTVAAGAAGWAFTAARLRPTGAPHPEPA
jgi:hypothetical protein